MRVPIRKPGKYTHVKTDPHITMEKFEELKLEVEKIKKNIRPSAIKEVERLAMMGDFSENFAYQAAKGRLRHLNDRISEIESLLGNAQIIDARPNTDFIQLGNFVTIKIANQIKTFQLLGSSEINLSANIISHNSPLGSALMNRRVGDVVSFEVGGKKVECDILKIE